MNQSVLESCVEHCSRCQQVCDACAVACLPLPAMATCVQACHRCADECNYCVMMIETGSYGECETCADACEQCAIECERHLEVPECLRCAEACRDCARVLRQTRTLV